MKERRLLDTRGVAVGCAGVAKTICVLEVMVCFSSGNSRWDMMGWMMKMVKALCVV